MVKLAAQTPTARKARGFSMVELMVAVLIALIGRVIIFQVYAVSEGYKRTTTGGGEAQNNGAIGLFAIERDIRLAGYGINTLDFLGCTIYGWDEQAGGGLAFTLTFAPVVITQGAGGAPDTITTFYGNSSLQPAPGQIVQSMSTPAAAFPVDNQYGFIAGDVVVAAQTGSNCTLAQVSSLPGSNNLLHDSGPYGTPPLPTRYNKPGGPCPTPQMPCVSYAPASSARLYDLGPSPSNNTYSIQNSQLMLRQFDRSTPPLGVFATSAIFDGIVQLKAQYGKDKGLHPGHVAGDNVIDTFDNAAPTSTAEWAQVLAIRVALAARSSQYEKTAVSPATINLLPALNPPLSTSFPQAAAVNWTLASADQNYRYKVFQTVVPIRNMIWRPW